MKPGIDYIGVSVGALIVNDNGEIFLTKRGAKATNERGTWEIPGGKVHFGETLVEAIQREMKEEYGVDLVLTYQFPAQNHMIPDEHQHWVPTCFISHIANGQEPKILESEKCEALGWFALGNLPEPLSIITKFDIENYRKYLAKRDVNVVE
ncbi:MAG TPA: NUDIX domain-containing protein [Patescibacteria group bacterium]|nr:NUDIX domain-containing protein [Patescibacteria group bacterium]